MYYLVKCISLWNWLTEKSTNVCKSTVYFYSYVVDYFFNTHNQWIFTPGHPVPMNQVTVIPNNNKWQYNATDNVLTYYTNDVKCSFSWLSAKLMVYENEIHSSEYEPPCKEYNIDDFISTLRIYTVANRPPTLMMIFMLWCIYTKQWFSSSANIEFHVINDLGEEHVYYSQFLGSLTIRNQKIY